ncbi:hypothetical protein [Nocardia alni]|uniref:hypothetical protein n=1 Tax=Nocardia alni TaxID=2815723 RepID=UPI0027DED493|nr:hypothetical protein [Nocardia alni]
MELRDQDDFTSLSVVVVTPSRVWLDPAGLTELAGRGGDEIWRTQLAGMVDYAESKGWLDEAGRVSAHVRVENH